MNTTYTIVNQKDLPHDSNTFDFEGAKFDSNVSFIWADIPALSVDLSFLGYLARFVNFVDAIHDSGLPLLIRGTHRDVLDSQTAGKHLDSILAAYDQRVAGHYGEVARIEWARCLSRLQSREAINAQVWPLESEHTHV